jgi:hypothetical protein
MQTPTGEHYNVVFEPSQASNSHSGPYVIGYLFPDGPHSSRIEQYRVTVTESAYRQAVKEAKRLQFPWEFLYRRFRPIVR